MVQPSLIDEIARLLKRRDRSRAQLRRKLDGLAPAESIVRALDEAESLGYVDDARFAKARVRGASQRLWSAARVRADLADKGVDAALVDAALEDHDDLSCALRRLERSSGTRSRERALASLARAGFSYDVAEDAWRAFQENTDEDHR